MRKIWLLFAQATTVVLAAFFTIGVLKPEWIGKSPQTTIVPLQQAVSNPAAGTGKYTPSFRNAAQMALPAVVHIFTTQEVKVQRHPLMNDPVFRQFFGDGLDNAPRRPGLGSGVIVSPNGYILTNYHVVDAADAIEILLADKRRLKARVVGADPESDLAVLQVEADNLPAITFGRMEDVAVGDAVLAIGNPFGVGQTVTMGIVSALGRTQLGINTFENFIQTDAAINPGNSGGALVDVNGNLIGINTAIFSRSGGSLGIGFAIPVSSAQQIMRQIIQNGKVIRGWIGVEVQEITQELAESFGLPDAEGALIAGVVRGGPADQSGFKPGDVLLEADGRQIHNPQDMLDIVASLKPGNTVTFKVRRARTVNELEVRVGQRPMRRR
ncbi:MAG: Do family serine endopeptidase [Zoogloeaceae bacterium]|jgi:Do/DeqQ family serine protease|nr:Do family serine endopeptidase [Zoogloeaceae bacterium]